MNKTANNSKILIGSLEEFSDLLNPIIDQLDTLIKSLSNVKEKSDAVYSDTEAAIFLKMSKKKLQNLRNSRKIGFFRENEGRKVSYMREHLITYLKKHEIKAIN